MAAVSHVGRWSESDTTIITSCVLLHEVQNELKIE